MATETEPAYQNLQVESLANPNGNAGVKLEAGLQTKRYLDELYTDFGPARKTAAYWNMFNFIQECANYQLPESSKNAVEKVGRLVQAENQWEPTAEPAVKLSLYNFLNQNPDANTQTLFRELKKMAKLSNLETKLSRPDNPLPTIGIEIELPISHLNKNTITVLNALGIHNGVGFIDPELWEVNPDFSYSAEVQSRFLQELAKMGAIPLEEKNKQKPAKVPKTETFSLHLNFGMPKELSKKTLDKFKTEIGYLNNSVTFAFTSAERILNRKTGEGLKFQDKASPSKKSQPKPTPAETPKTPENESIWRIEMRALEFRDYPTFRMLKETQQLMGVLIAFIKKQSALTLNDKERALAEIWPKFAEDFKIIVEKSGLHFGQYGFILDKRAGRVAWTLDYTGLTANCRNLITRYAKEIALI